MILIVIRRLYEKEGINYNFRFWGILILSKYKFIDMSVMLMNMDVIVCWWFVYFKVSGIILWSVRNVMIFLIFVNKFFRMWCGMFCGNKVVIMIIFRGFVNLEKVVNWNVFYLFFVVKYIGRVIVIFLGMLWRVMV